MCRKNTFYFIAVIILVVTTSFAPILKIGDKAPDFTLATLNPEDIISLSDYKGKVVVIHLWSHTCPHCRESNKTLPDIVNPYKKCNLAYIMIDIDMDTTGWRSVIEQDKLNFAVQATDPYDGDSKTMIAYNGPGTPCINVSDEKGNLIALNITNLQLKKFLKKRFPSVK